jgi:hypothetical protein
MRGWVGWVRNGSVLGVEATKWKARRWQRPSVQHVCVCVCFRKDPTGSHASHGACLVVVVVDGTHCS